MGNDQTKLKHKIAQSRGIKVDDLPEKLVLLSKDSTFEEKTKYHNVQSKKAGVILQSMRQVQSQYDYVEYLPLVDSDRLSTFKLISERYSQEYKRLLLQSYDEINRRVDSYAWGAGEAGAAAGGAFAGPSAAMAAINAIGFTSSGVAPGSLAAFVQVAKVSAGSAFAMLQSAGATGTFATTTIVGTASGGMIVAGSAVIGAKKLSLAFKYYLKLEVVRKYLVRYDPQFQVVLKQLRNTVKSQNITKRGQIKKEVILSKI